MSDRKGQTNVLRYHSHLPQPKCLTSPIWLRSPISTRQSWRRRRQKRKTLCPPKRVSFPLALWMMFNPVTIFLSAAPHHFPRRPKGPHAHQAAERRHIAATSARCSCCSNPEMSIPSPPPSLPPNVFTEHVSADQHRPLLVSFSHRAREERRCHTLTSEHTKKRTLRCHSKKALCFDYHSISITLLCLREKKWVLRSSLGCCNGMWHPHKGALLPLSWKKALAWVLVLRR